MAFIRHVIITFVVFSDLISGLVHPLTKPNGERDLSSIIFHITMMEGSMKQLETKAQAAHDQLIVVNGRLKSTSDELKTTQERLRLAETDIITLRNNKHLRPTVVELSNMKSDIATLKSSMESIDLTIAYDLSTGLKTNTRSIQALKSVVMANSANIKNTRLDGELNSLADRKLRAKVAHLITDMGHARNVTPIAELLNMKSDITDLKSSKAQANVNVTILDALTRELRTNSKAIKSLASTVETNSVKINNTMVNGFQQRKLGRHVQRVDMSKEQQPSMYLTMIDVIGMDLKTNTRAIQDLKSTVAANSVKIDKANTNVQTPYAFVMIKTRLNLAEADIITLRHDKNQRPAAVELTIMKSDIAHLKSSKAQQPNINAMSMDLIRNTRAIKALQSTVDTNIEDIRRTRADAELKGLQQKDLREKVRHLSTEVTNTRNTAKSTMSDIQSLKSQSRALNTTLHEVVDNLDTLKLVTPLLMAKIASDIHFLELQMMANISRLRDIFTTNIAELVSNLEKLTGLDIDNKQVAFQVTQSVDQNHWTTLHFDTVDFNQGGGYNSASGYFTAPVSGTYLFWCNILIYHSDGRLYIYKGSSSIAQGYTYTADNQVAMTVVTHMSKGEKVHFAAHSTDITVDGSESHYGGALLHAS